MFNILKRKYLYLSFLIFLIIKVHTVSAIGISPASIIINFEPNFEKSYTFYTATEDNIEIYVEGDLAEYVTIETNDIAQEGTFIIKVKLPAEIETPGDNIVFVGITEAGEDEGMARGKASIRTPLVIRVPYPEIYAEIGFETHDLNINETTDFIVTLNNFGQVDIDNALAVIDIFNSNEIIVESLFTEEKTVKNKTNETLEAFFNASKHASGTYKAIAHVTYADEAKDLEADFRIGTLIDPTTINVGPKIGNVIQISVNCTDAFGLSSIWYANNATGTLENKSNINFLDPPLNAAYIVNHTVILGTIQHQFTCNDIFSNSVQNDFREIIYSSSTAQEVFHDNGQVDADGWPISFDDILTVHNWTYQNHHSSDLCGESKSVCDTRYTNISSIDSNNLKMFINYNKNYGVSIGARGARWWIDLSKYLTDRTAFSIEMDAVPQDYCPNHYPVGFSDGSCKADMSIKLINGNIFNDGVHTPDIESQPSCDFTFQIPDCIAKSGSGVCTEFDKKHVLSSCTGNQTVRSNETRLGNFEYDMWAESKKMYKIQGTYLNGVMSWYIDGQHSFTHTTTMDLPKILMLKCGRTSSLDKKGSMYILSCLYDNIRVCEGANNCTTEDERPPFVLDITTNNTTPYIYEVIQITGAATDYSSIESVYYADNRTGEFQNVSSATGLSNQFLNYSVNITNNLIGGVVVGAIFTFIDSSGNNIQSSALLYTTLGTPPTFDPSLTNKITSINEEFIFDINCSDEDNDTITFFGNSTEFDINRSTGLIRFTPTTNGIFPVEITCNDGTDNTSQTFNINITGADIDKDGINDAVDFLRGDISNINTNIVNLSVDIQGSQNLSKFFSGRQKVKFYQKGRVILEFDFNFSSEKILDFTNISVLNTLNSSLGSMVISGIDLTNTGSTKTAYLEKVNQEIDGICIKDEEIEWAGNITDSCEGDNEFMVECDGSMQSEYTCTYNSSSRLYKITGLKHTGVKQLDYFKPSDDSPSDTGDKKNSGGGGSGGGGSGGGISANPSAKTASNPNSEISSSNLTSMELNKEGVAFTGTICGDGYCEDNENSDTCLKDCLNKETESVKATGAAITGAVIGVGEIKPEFIITSIIVIGLIISVVVNRKKKIKGMQL